MEYQKWKQPDTFFFFFFNKFLQTAFTSGSQISRQICKKYTSTSLLLNSRLERLVALRRTSVRRRQRQKCNSRGTNHSWDVTGLCLPITSTISTIASLIVHLLSSLFAFFLNYWNVSLPPFWRERGETSIPTGAKSLDCIFIKQQGQRKKGCEDWEPIGGGCDRGIDLNMETSS